MTDYEFKTVALIKESEKKLNEIAEKVDITECEYFDEYLSQLEDEIEEEASYIKDELDVESYARDWWDDYTYEYFMNTGSDEDGTYSPEDFEYKGGN